MTLQILGYDAYEVRRDLQRPGCPRCGEMLMAAKASELIGRGRIRNSWCCDNCGHDFATTIRLSPLLVPLDDLD